MKKNIKETWCLWRRRL